MMKDIGIGSAIAYMKMMMDVEGAIAIFTTMRVIEMTMVMDMTTMIALVFTTKEAGMSGLVCHRNRHKLVTTGSVMNCSNEWPTGRGPPPIDSRTGFRGNNA